MLLLDMLHFLASLHMLPGMTHDRLRRLSEIYECDYERAWHSLDHQVLHTLGVEKYAAQIAEKQQQVNPCAAERYIKEKAIHMITKLDYVFPSFLYETKPSPFVLYLRGDSDLLVPQRQRIAFVGSRKMTSYGKRTVGYLLEKLHGYNLTTVSGLAYGIDAACHRYSIDYGLSTIAVLGSGVDRVYPASHSGLMEDILSSKGLLISEFPIGSSPRPYHFPLRNRMVASMSDLTIVVEAAHKSGSLITASLALEYGREVGAVPGDIFSSTSHGTNGLLARGEAAVVRDSDDILHMLGIASHSSETQEIREIDGPLAKVLSFVPMEQDELVKLSGLNASRCGQELSLLELDGLITKVEGTKWVRC